MDKSLNILITGGTGFIGSYLTPILLQQGHFLTIVTRSPEKYKEDQASNQQFITADEIASKMSGMDVVINLAGESLFGFRWTDEVKKRIYESRILLTRSLTDAMIAAEKKPALFISASAVGIYGDSGDNWLDESSAAGDDFLASVCADWEAEAVKAEAAGIRVAIPRIGIVLQDNGGMIDKMKLPFALFAGGPIGSGEQYIPWVHMDDLCRALIYPIENENLSGPYNACSPDPATMNELASAMGKVMNRPSFFRVPEFVLKAILGEAAQPALSSLRVQPKVLQLSDFEFEYESLESALGDIL
jgi:uncharacterized protein (TIGR01777 family)